MSQSDTTQTADAAIAAGQRAFDRGDVEAARQSAMQTLQQSPDHLGALVLLYHCHKRASIAGLQVENLLRKIVSQDPNLLWATSDLAFALFQRGERIECETHARNALRIAPRNAVTHTTMGLILTETNRAHAGEYHFRTAIEIGGEGSRACTNLANCLRVQGKLDDSETWFRKALDSDPNNANALVGWSRLEEVRRNIPHAWELVNRAEKIGRGELDLSLTRAILYGREKKNAEALAELSRSREASLAPVALLERGRLYDKMERYDDAWTDFTEAKRIAREVQGHRYQEALAAGTVERLKGFFTRERMTILPRASASQDGAQPLFITGFPRSGTTMVEQTLAAHPHVTAGDELPFLESLTRIAPRLLGSPLAFPECLADLWMGDNQRALDQFRDYYLQSADQLGIRDTQFFTDKMPLNETWLGLIALVFPGAPIIHVRRHPLDVVVSNFSNYLTHGFDQSFDVATSAKHLLLIDSLVEHYKRELDLKIIDVRYEDLVRDQEADVKRMAAFAGLAFDPAMLAFHENPRYARTASYAQVTEPLYDSSLHRHRHYRKHLDEAAAILAPLITRWGYAAD